MRHTVVYALLLAAALSAADSGDWPVYGHDAGGSKFSPLNQIDRRNVASLRQAWVFHTKDSYDPHGHGGRRSALETTPLYVDGVLYLTTAFGRIIALDPIRGTELWNFDPHAAIDGGYGDFANRGVATWVDSKTGKRLLFVATIDAHLFAVDAATGKGIETFGTGGSIDLRKGLRIEPKELWEYEETSPPTVIGDVVVVGSAVPDNYRANATSGEVRGFDARTGKLRWTWDPLPGTQIGAANAWSIFSADPERGLLFVPTGSASPDYYGATRPGDNRYANSLAALKGDSGKLVWSFQTVHHDLWDFDVASQPALITVKRGGRSIAAVAVGSKTGNLFILERATGKPVYGVEERPVPKSDVPGEEASPTQPFPVLPKPLVPQAIKPEDAWGFNEEQRKWCADLIANSRNEGIFTPPSLKGTISFPGNIGGMAWGGVAFDPLHNRLIVPTNRLAAFVKLIPRDEYGKPHEEGYEYAAQKGTPYGMARKFVLAPNGGPCNRPPWGTLAAVNLGTGAIDWDVTLGGFPGVPEDVAEKLGSPSLGGPIVTAGGLAIIGGSFDPHIRAFDVETGRMLWKGELPHSARATPMTFRAKNGKQYIVIAAGGHDTGRTVPGKEENGDEVIAFALPDQP